MKIRNGFVSNSSSSSFIIGVGLLKDKNAKRSDVVEYYTKTDVKQNLNYSERLDRVKIESFNGDEVTLEDISELAEDDIIIIADMYGDGDQFWDEEYEEYDYDNVSEDDLDVDQQEAIEVLVENNCTYSIGAGRDG